MKSIEQLCFYINGMDEIITLIAKPQWGFST